MGLVRVVGLVSVFRVSRVRIFHFIRVVGDVGVAHVVSVGVFRVRVILIQLFLFCCFSCCFRSFTIFGFVVVSL